MPASDADQIAKVLSAYSKSANGSICYQLVVLSLDSAGTEGPAYRETEVLQVKLHAFHCD